MTHIFNITRGLVTPYPQQARKHETPQSHPPFADALKSSTAASPSPAAPSNALGEIVPPSLPPAAAGPNTLWQDIDGLIDSLEVYARKLENPDHTLKELDPLIAGIRERAQEVLETARTAGDGDALQQIAAECAVTAEMEYIRFKRGDYL